MKKVKHREKPRDRRETVEMRPRYASGGRRAEEYTDDKEGCMTARSKVFLVSIISFVVAATVVLLVVLTRIDDSALTDSQSDQDQCEDIVIVGAGLAGTYFAWKLRGQNLSITLLERSDRIGGRFYTRTFPNASEIKLELGASYFVPELHEHMNRTIAELGLDTKHYAETDDFSYFLRGMNLKKDDLFGSGDDSLKSPYNLVSGERNSSSVYTMLYSALDKLKYRCNEDLYETINANHTHHVTSASDGNSTTPKPIEQDDTGDRLACKKNIEDMLIETLSYEAYHLTRDALLPEELIHTGSTGVLWDYVEHLPSKGAGPTPQKMTPADGMETLPKTLLKKAMAANPKLKLDLNRQVTGFEEMGGVIQIEITGTETKDGGTSLEQNPSRMCSGRMVLAMPPSAIQGINWSLMRNDRTLSEAMETLQPVSAIKAFFAYPSTDVEYTVPNHTVPVVMTDLPIGQVIDLGRSEDGSQHIFQVLYTGSRDYDYWRERLSSCGRHGDCAITETFTQRLEVHLRRLLSSYGVKLSLGNARGIVHVWTGEYGHAWDVWKPGVDWRHVSNIVESADENSNVHIISSGFAEGHKQLYAEGALEAAEKLLSKMLSD